MTSDEERYIRDKRSPAPRSSQASFVMSKNKARNTGPELKLRKTLWANGLRGYRIHLKTCPGRPDIAYTKKKLAIFVNGCFWHRCPYCYPHEPQHNSEFWKKKFERNVERDKRKVQELKDAGWSSLTIWECQINNYPEEQAKRIAETLASL
jgi:DNA mismatch endonuclease (patch repair protein)